MAQLITTNAPQTAPQPAPVIVPRANPGSEGRWIWASSTAIERIVNELGASDAVYGIGVYMALCKMSGTDKNNPRITATIQKIAGSVSISYPKCRAILNALELQAKVIAIERHPREDGDVKQAPHTYTLLSFRRNAVTSGRRNTVSSGRRNGGDVTEQAICGSEIPKEMPLERALIEKQITIPTALLPTGGTGLEGQPPVTGCGNKMIGGF